MKNKVTPKEKILDKREKIKKLFEHHTSIFKKLKIDKPQYIPKMAYYDRGLGETVISFFESEMNGEDVYTEFISRDCDSEDESRTLYLWKYNPHFKSEYKTTAPHPTTGDVRYLIPVSELIVVEELIKDLVEDEDEFLTDIPNPDLDLPMDQMTLRDYACIQLKVASSFKPWLNEIISKAK